MAADVLCELDTERVEAGILPVEPGVSGCQ
jgi:hypothetical protein